MIRIFREFSIIAYGNLFRCSLPPQLAGNLLTAVCLIGIGMAPILTDGLSTGDRPSGPLPILRRPIPPPLPVKRMTSVKPIRPLAEKAHPEHRFHPMIVKAADRYDVDPALIKAIIRAESGYDAKAVSKKGAIGLMQLMPSTAAELGVTDGFDPEHNINGGVKYLRKLMDQFDGDIRLALAAYNAGSRNVRTYRGVPPFKATRFYVKKVFRLYEFYKKQTDSA